MPKPVDLYLNLNAPCLIKVVRTGFFDFHRYAAESFIGDDKAPRWLTRRPLRIRPKEPGQWAWRSGEPSYEIGQKSFVDKTKKQGFSKPQSTTYCHVEAKCCPPPLSIFGLPLVGFRFDVKSAIVSRLSSDINTAYRTYGCFNTKEAAEADYRQRLSKANGVLYENVEALEKEAQSNPAKVPLNEVIARLHWNIPTCTVCYFYDDDKSKLVAQVRALDIHRRLKLDKDKPIFISYYLPENFAGRATTETGFYTEEQQKQSRLKVWYNSAADLEEKLLVSFIYLQRNDFDIAEARKDAKNDFDSAREKSNAATTSNPRFYLSFSVKHIIQLMSYASKLMYATSHIFFQKLVEPDLSKMAPLLTTAQWKQLFDCIDHTQSSAWFDKIYQAYPQQRSKICCGYLVCLIERNSEDFHAEISKLCREKHADFVAKMDPKKEKRAIDEGIFFIPNVGTPGSTPLTPFGIASGKFGVTKILLENFSDLDTTHALFYVSDTLKHLLNYYKDNGKKPIPSSLILNTNLYDAVLTGKTQKANALLDQKADPYYCPPDSRSILALAISTRQNDLAINLCQRDSWDAVTLAKAFSTAVAKKAVDVMVPLLLHTNFNYAFLDETEVKFLTNNVNAELLKLFLTYPKVQKSFSLREGVEEHKKWLEENKKLDNTMLLRSIVFLASGVNVASLKVFLDQPYEYTEWLEENKKRLGQYHVMLLRLIHHMKAEELLDWLLKIVFNANNHLSGSRSTLVLAISTERYDFAISLCQQYDAWDAATLAQAFAVAAEKKAVDVMLALRLHPNFNDSLVDETAVDFLANHLSPTILFKVFPAYPQKYIQCLKEGKELSNECGKMLSPFIDNMTVRDFLDWLPTILDNPESISSNLTLYSNLYGAVLTGKMENANKLLDDQKVDPYHRPPGSRAILVLAISAERNDFALRLCHAYDAWDKFTLAKAFSVLFRLDFCQK